MKEHIYLVLSFILYEGLIFCKGVLGGRQGQNLAPGQLVANY